MIEETEEDLQTLVGLFEALDIRVRRPKTQDVMRPICTPDWRTYGYFPYCPRDILLAIGDTIVEAPSYQRSRYLEAFAYRHLQSEYLHGGARWLSAPRPRLDERSLDPNATPGRLLNEVEPIFDAANVLRIGRDILYQVSDSGNVLGALWLQRTLGDSYRVHITDNIYPGTHIDSTIALLRPGLVLLNPSRVSRDRVPTLFNGWDHIYAPEMVEYSYSDLQPFSSKWLGMNLLMVSPEVAMVDAHQVPLMRLLSKHHIECIPVALRHGRVFGGGVHCVTLDVRRKGSLEDYRCHSSPTDFASRSTVSSPGES